MTDSVNIEVEGADEIAYALKYAPQLAGPVVEKGVSDSIAVIYDTVAPYPPQPSRTRAKTFNTYVRGWGQMNRASFDEGGSYIGPTVGPRGGAPVFGSEDLGLRWGMETRKTPIGYLGVLGNPVTYASLVQGEKQTSYHKETGWITILDAAKASAKKIQMIFNGVAFRIAKGLDRLMQ